MTHTPGPWIITGRSIYALDETDHVNRFMLTIYGGCVRSGKTLRDTVQTSDQELRDNLRLIKAAPDMLAALQEVSAWAEQANPAGYGGLRDSLFCKVQAAITKAT